MCWQASSRRGGTESSYRPCSELISGTLPSSSASGGVPATAPHQPIGLSVCQVEKVASGGRQARTADELLDRSSPGPLLTREPAR